MSNKKMILHFTLLTFIIAYSTSGLLIILGQYGYKVYNWVNTLQQFIMNIPFAIYILSPAIASFAILKKYNKITDIKEWLKTVFYAKNSLYAYLYVIAILTLYFLIHMFVTGNTKIALPFYTFFLSLPGCLLVGCTYYSLNSIRNMVIFYHQFILVLSGSSGIFPSFLFLEQIMVMVLSTFGCLQYKLCRFVF